MKKLRFLLIPILIIVLAVSFQGRVYSDENTGADVSGSDVDPGTTTDNGGSEIQTPDSDPGGGGEPGVNPDTGNDPSGLDVSFNEPTADSPNGSYTFTDPSSGTQVTVSVDDNGQAGNITSTGPNGQAFGAGLNDSQAPATPADPAAIEAAGNAVANAAAPEPNAAPAEPPAPPTAEPPAPAVPAAPAGSTGINSLTPTSDVITNLSTNEFGTTTTVTQNFVADNGDRISITVSTAPSAFEQNNVAQVTIADPKGENAKTESVSWSSIANSDGSINQDKAASVVGSLK